MAPRMDLIKGMCFKKIGVHAQHITIGLGSITNIIVWGDLYDHYMSTRIVTLIMNAIFIRTSKFIRKVVLTSIWIC